MRHITFSLLVFIFLVSCSQESKVNTAQTATDSTANLSQAKKDDPSSGSSDKKAIEEKITKLLEDLPEVKAEDKRLQTQFKKGLSSTVDAEPSSTDPNYTIVFGFDGEERFETYFTFSVNPKTLEIKVVDESGETISLEAWRKKAK